VPKVIHNRIRQGGGGTHKGPETKGGAPCACKGFRKTDDVVMHQKTGRGIPADSGRKMLGFLAKEILPLKGRNLEEGLGKRGGLWRRKIIRIQRKKNMGCRKNNKKGNVWDWAAHDWGLADQV